MKFTTLCFFCLIVLSACSGPTVMDKRAGSVLRVFAVLSDGTSKGSGFVIGKKGEIATNHHVIEGADRIRVGILIRNEIHISDAKVVWSDERRDLAVLIPNKMPPCPRLKLNTRTPQKGDAVFSLGFPGLADAKDPATEQNFRDVFLGNNNLISRPTPDQENIFISSSSSSTVRRIVERSWDSESTGMENPRLTLIESDTNISGGNSGGPLFNARGEVIGINTQIVLGKGLLGLNEEGQLDGTVIVRAPGWSLSSAIIELVSQFKNNSDLASLGVALDTTSLPIFEVAPLIFGSLMVLFAAVVGVLLIALKRPSVLEPLANHSQIVSNVLRRLEANKKKVPITGHFYEGGFIRREDGRVVSVGGGETLPMSDQPKSPDRNKISKITLTARTPGGKSFDHVIRSSSGKVLIGRSRFSDFVITEESVSKKHAMFFFGEGRMEIKDLGSANGTVINNRRVSKDELQRINNGDVVLIGRTSMKVVVL